MVLSTVFRSQTRKAKLPDSSKWAVQLSRILKRAKLSQCQAPMAKNQVGCFLNALRTVLEVVPLCMLHAVMRRIRKGRGGNLMLGPLNCRA